MDLKKYLIKGRSSTSERGEKRLSSDPGGGCGGTVGAYIGEKGTQVPGGKEGKEPIWKQPFQCKGTTCEVAAVKKNYTLMSLCTKPPTDTAP